MSLKKDIDIKEFAEYLSEKLGVKPPDGSITGLKDTELYRLSDIFSIPDSQTAEYAAEFLGLTYIPFLDPETVVSGRLAGSFCSRHFILPLLISGEERYVLANPFEKELGETPGISLNEGIYLTEPENIVYFLENSPAGYSEKIRIISEKSVREEAVASPAVYLSDSIIYKALLMRASDIHIEPKEEKTAVRLRIDGELTLISSVSIKSSLRIISRLKVLAGLDISEKRKPQDGSFKILSSGKKYNARVASANTPNGESMIIRLLEETSTPRTLDLLGMTVEQRDIMLEFAEKKSGLLLVVGPTGSGKTTTLYSLINHIDCKARSLLTVEDPIEYNLPNANQQQVNDKIGVTFARLLRSALRQDPDILFIGEIRDSDSASCAVESAGTGHLTLSTMHTSNLWSALNRLKLLGVSKDRAFESLIGIISQRLIRILCPFCKKSGDLKEEERKILEGYSENLSYKVFLPSGCPRCSHTGYLGREAVYEIVRFDGRVKKILQEGESIYEIRARLREEGFFLMPQHLLDKFGEGKIPPDDLIRELKGEDAGMRAFSAGDRKEKSSGPGFILVVEDDKDTQKMLEKLLLAEGYEVQTAYDGAEALIKIGGKEFDLIISDINMPHLDGNKLLEICKEKKIRVPVLFLTGRSSPADQIEGLKSGAVDYIIKPFDGEILLFKIKKILEQKSSQSNI